MPWLVIEMFDERMVKTLFYGFVGWMGLEYIMAVTSLFLDRTAFFATPSRRILLSCVLFFIWSTK